MSSTGAVLADVKANPEEFTANRVRQELQVAAEKLPAKRIALVDHYVNNGFNGLQAYREAGYRAKSATVATVESSRILAIPSVRQYLRWKLVELTTKEGCEVDEGRLIRESNALAYSSLTDVIEWDAHGNMILKPSSEIPREVAVAVKKIKSTSRVIPVKDGDPIRETRVEIEMHDKKGALDLLARIAGMLREDPNARADNVPFILNMYIGERPPKKDKGSRVVAG